MKSLLIALLLAAGAGCAPRDPSFCCDAFSANDDNGIYCNGHKDVVLRFVRDGRTAEEQRGRLEWFKGVFKEIEPLEDSDQIHDRLARFEKSRPEFWVHYNTQHFWAGRDTNLGLERRGQLMKCGFRHGIRVIELEARALSPIDYGSANSHLYQFLAFFTSRVNTVPLPFRHSLGVERL